MKADEPHEPHAPDADRFRADVRKNPFNAALLDGLPDLDLPDCWLVAGCLFQTVWNIQTHKPPEANIHDYDVFYFDASDLSNEAEAAVGQRVAAHFAHLPVAIEVKNQARMHTWYEAYFNEPYSALADSRESFERFLVACTCVGVRVGDEVVVAQNGLGELYAGVLRPNWVHRRELFDRKVASYVQRWPHLVLKE